MGRRVKETKKTFSCLQCGTAFDAYPPDDLHDIATRDENAYENNIKIPYKCKVCGKENFIFWGQSDQGFM